MKSYREHIQERLAHRIAFNPRYSLRALARDLGISAGQLSLVLSGKKGLSHDRAREVFKKLGLKDDELDQYLLQVKRDHSRSRKKRDEARAELEATLCESSDQIQLTQDAFATVSEWYHFAIIQALALKAAEKLKSEIEQVKWLALRLGLHEQEVRLALERLSRLELIELNRQRYRIIHETVLNTKGVHSVAVRKFHSQVLKKALGAIESQTVEERYLNSVLLPVKSEDRDQIRKEILRFQKSILKRFGRVKQMDGDHVYALSSQFFLLAEEK